MPADLKLENWVEVLDLPLRAPRRLRVICIGAGYSGLTLAYKVKSDGSITDYVDLQIYEKNSSVGGTWFENRYPGVACDVPAHVYVFPFEPNPEWSSFYADGSEILQYIKKTALKYNLEEYVSLNSRVLESIWHEDSGKWKVKVERGGQILDDECDVLINGSGVLSKWKWPQIEGLFEFKGKLLHTADWDMAYDWAGKKVAVVGNGSSAIQLVPQLQKTAKHIVNYVRSPTWIAANFLAEFTQEGKNFRYSEEKKREWRENPELHFKMRKELEHAFNRSYIGHITGTPEQIMMEKAATEIMTSRLAGDKDLLKRLLPSFKPGCRRLSPGDGYLEALQQDNVSTCWTPITKITEKGILTQDGEEEFDLIVTATGFDVSFRPSWNLVGRNGVRLEEAWKDEPKGYLGVCAVDHPNYFIYMGPNSPVAHGVLTGAMDAVTDYILKWCRKIATEDIKYISVKAKAVDDLSVYSQEVIKRTVFAEKCRSWYKNGKEDGKVTALHAGSALHYREMLQDLRGEDFQFTYRSANEFRFLGNGLTHRDSTGADLAYYLKMP